jgi:hypothetical protein
LAYLRPQTEAGTDRCPDQHSSIWTNVEKNARSTKVRQSGPRAQAPPRRGRLLALEDIAARSAAEHCSSFHLARLRGAIAEIRATDTGNPRAMAAANLTFHQALWSAGRNATLIEMFFAGR